MKKLKEEAWSLTSGDTVAIPSANRVDGTATKWSDIWKYQVPVGQSHVLLPSHRFSAYLEDASAQVSNGTCRIKIEIRDQSEQDAQVIYGPSLYVDSKEFQDDEKMVKLSLRDRYIVDEKFFIVIAVNDDGAIDESDSYFNLETIRVRYGIG